MTTDNSARLLVIDDNPSIHGDFTKILAPTQRGSSLDQLAHEFFGDIAGESGARPSFDIGGASQGREGLEMVRSAISESSPYAVVFVDMRMPPGWDGLETVQAIWRVDSDVETVICTAHTDRSWETIWDRLGRSDRLQILKKPFDAVEIRQLAYTLSERWAVKREMAVRLRTLERRLVDEIARREQFETELRLLRAGRVTV